MLGFHSIHDNWHKFTSSQTLKFMYSGILKSPEADWLSGFRILRMYNNTTNVSPREVFQPSDIAEAYPSE